MPLKAPLHSAIVTEQVQFTGSPIFDENGTMFVPGPASPYIGQPNNEIDLAWEELISGTKSSFPRTKSRSRKYLLIDFTARYFLITEDEASATWPDNHGEYWSVHRQGYVAGYIPWSRSEECHC